MPKNSLPKEEYKRLLIEHGINLIKDTYFEFNPGVGGSTALYPTGFAKGILPKGFLWSYGTQVVIQSYTTACPAGRPSG